MIKKYQCELCNIGYKCNSGLWRHNQKLHNINKELKLRCINCDKECKSRQSLYYHKKVCRINTNLVTKEEFEKIKNELLSLKTTRLNNTIINNTINNDNRKQIIINYTPGTEPIDHLSVKQQKEIMDVQIKIFSFLFTHTL